MSPSISRPPPLVFTPPPHSPFSTPLRQACLSYISSSFTLPAFAQMPANPLRVVTVRGDGRCLFRAIAKNLAHNDQRRLSENLERADADALRQIAWKEICVSRTKEFESRHVIEGSIRSYCARMRNPAFFAGEAELLALSDYFKMPIMVYLAERTGFRNIVTYGDKYAKSKSGKPPVKPVRLLYVNGNHYNALLPR